jgi:hypothetical protein
VPTETRTVHAEVWVHRPTRVRAMQLTGDTYGDVFAWMTQSGAYFWGASDDVAEIAMWLDSAAPGQDSKVRVRTPQGARKVLMGDWIVWGLENIWYPVADAVWRASYDPAEDIPAADRHHDDD